jgi:hypothetical protein
MNISVLNVQNKARTLTHALLQRGHTFTSPGQADLLLIDIDDPDAPGRSEMIAATKENGGAVLLYPHGAREIGTYHGFYEPDPRIDAQVVHGPGFPPVLEAAGLDRPVHVVGWSYSPRVPFSPPDRVERILFGPMHPYGSGQIAEEQQHLNGRVFDALTHVPDVVLSVQLYGPPALNGLWDADGVAWVPSILALDWAAVDAADLVVAEGTLAMLAMARGKPVVTIGAHLLRDDEHGRPRRPDYPFCVAPRYPLDFDDGPLSELIEAARAGSAAVEDWVADFVGGPFDRSSFCDLAEEYAYDDRRPERRRELLLTRED